MKKLLKTLVVSAVIMSMFAVPVMAAYYEFHVEYDAEDADQVQYSSNETKYNYNDYAVVSYDGINWNGRDFRFCVVGQYGDNSQKTESIQPTAYNGDYHLSYTNGWYYGNNYRLCGVIYDTFADVSGTWEP